MTNQEAKFILDAYRPNGRDANEPMFAAALKQAEQDPALREWFAREQRHAAAIAGKLREVAPPPGLREAILAGARVSKVPERSRWLRPSWLALAASVVVLFVLGVWRWTLAAPMNRLEAFVVSDALHAQHGSHGAASSALVAMLSKPATHLGGTLPVDFSTLRLSGCRTMSFAGRDVLEVCFNREGVDFHLYMLRREDFPGIRTADAPRFAEKDGVSLVSWADTAHRYVVVSPAGMASLQRVL